MGVARGSRTDVIVGQRFTGVFAKIAATELVSANPPSIQSASRKDSAPRFARLCGSDAGLA